MRKAQVSVHGKPAGILEEDQLGGPYRFMYHPAYDGAPVSLTMPLDASIHQFDNFPPFFDGLLPEGIQLEGLLRTRKLDEHDLFGQLLAVGSDLVGAVTIAQVAS